MSELTLGGYMKKHDRAAAFGGSDGQAYSVAIYVDDEPDDARPLRRRPALRALVAGRRPARGARRNRDARLGAHARRRRAERLEALSLFDVKAALDEAIARAPAEW